MKKQIGLLFAAGVMVTATLIVIRNLPAHREAVPVFEKMNVAVPLTYGQDHRVLFGAEPVTADALQERIRQTVKMTGQKGVLLSADPGVRTDELVEVMDVLKASGVIDQIQLAHPN